MEKDYAGKIVAYTKRGDMWFVIVFTDGSSIEVVAESSEEGWLVVYED